MLMNVLLVNGLGFSNFDIGLLVSYYIYYVCMYVCILVYVSYFSMYMYREGMLNFPYV